jgi:hypothetical protein
MYFACTILTITAATIATLLGVAGVALGAAISAGVATLLTATEKGLRVQDRWRHHRATEFRYQRLQMSYALGYVDDHQAVDEMTRISELYDEKFPSEIFNLRPRARRQPNGSLRWRQSPADDPPSPTKKPETSAAPTSGARMK